MSQEIKKILHTLGTSPQKNLGQNFLINKDKIHKIVAEIERKSYDTIIEVGPGLGSITKEILKIQTETICIEKDTILYDYLKEEYKSYENFKIFNKDILRCELKNIGQGKRLFFGNLPYNIGTKILDNFVDTFCYEDNSTGIFMFQKEVAEKILSKKGSKSYNGFVVKVNSFFNITNLVDLTESDFWPQPKVKSVLIKLENRNKKFGKIYQYEEFSEFLFYCFSERRKKLINNLQRHYSKELVISALKNLELDVNIRAQDIDVDIFSEFFKILKNNRS